MLSYLFFVYKALSLSGLFSEKTMVEIINYSYNNISKQSS